MHRHFTIGFLALTVACMNAFAHPRAIAQALEAPAQAAEPPSSTAASETITEPERLGFDLEALLSPNGLTADEAARRAVESAPSVVRATAAALISQASVARVLHAMIPKLDLRADYTRISPVHNPSFSGGVSPAQEAALRDLIAQVDDPEAQRLFGINLEQQLAVSNFSFPVLQNQYGFHGALSYPVSDLFLKNMPAYRAAGMTKEANRVSIESERATIALQAREAFYNYIRARGVLGVAQASLRQSQTHKTQIDDLVQAGVSAAVEQSRIQAQVATAEGNVARAQAGVVVAEVALRTLIRAESESGDIPIAENVTTPLSESIHGTREEAVTSAFRDRPELRSLRTLILAREHEARATRAERLPTLSVNGHVDYANPNLRYFPQQQRFRASWDVGAALEWSPNDYLNGRQAGHEASARVMQARADLRAMEDSVRVEVSRAAADLEAAKAAMTAANTGIDAASESYRVRLEQFRAGTVSSRDVIDADGDLTRARLELINAAIDARIAAARLKRALGRNQI